MTIADLIAVRPFPAVVQAADVRALRSKTEPADDFIGGYLGFDERARHALEATLHSLSREEIGGGFFLNGVFGSGKSHLLGLLSLLCDGIGHHAFAQTHPHLAPLLKRFAPRLVVHFSLDEYDASHALEAIFWREVESEWARRGLPILELPQSGARGEKFSAFEDALQAQNLNGVVICMDEISLFLGGREHHALQNDASWLQFLGQRSRRSPLWVFGALQKSVELIGELEAYSLSQIRDRFTTLPLGVAHVGALIEHRLIVQRDRETLAQISRESWQELSQALPHLDFGLEEWARLYPFHPSTVALLESVVARFFSRTRSAALFCAHAARRLIEAKADAQTRVLPDELWDYFQPELDAHPDLRPLAQTWQTWQELLPSLAPTLQEAALLTRLMKGLLIFKIAGSAPTILQLANALGFDARLPGEGNYDYARVLLERLRAQGGQVAVERHPEAWGDRYTLDLGARVAETARRMIANTRQTLAPDDPRLPAFVLSCCRENAMPLATLEAGTTLPIMWRHAPRRMEVLLWDTSLNASILANRGAILGEPGQTNDALLLIVPPFSTVSDMAQDAWHEALEAVPDARFRGAMLLWTPRPATTDELESAREAVAQHLLEADPALLDNRRGRAVLAHLKNGAPERQSQQARIAARLLREGQIATGARLHADAGELVGEENWMATLESLCAFALPEVFPRWEEVAPRARVLTPSTSDALCLETLRRPPDAPYFAPSLERAVRAIAEPLGVANAHQGRWRIANGRKDLKRDLLLLINEGALLAEVEARMSKSEWGLAREQTDLLVCALLRAGELVALDARGTALSPHEIGMPLARSLRALRPGVLLDDASWARVDKILGLLDLPSFGRASFETLQAARASLLSWREEAGAETELAQARAHQMRRQLGHDVAQWPRAGESWPPVEALLRALDAKGTAADLLGRVAELDFEALHTAVPLWRQTLRRLDEKHAGLLSHHAFLTHPAFVVPPELQASRAELLERFGTGEAVLEDETLEADAADWRARYAESYREWHQAQHNPARFAVYRRWMSSDAFLALEQLETLSSRDFGAGRAGREAIQEELQKACARDGAIRDEPICAGCHLKWGERLLLRDPQELEAIVAQGASALQAALQETSAREFLSRTPSGKSLLEWDGDAANLLPLLSRATLHELDEALRPRREVSRSLETLRAQFAPCRTRLDFERAFKFWLEGTDNPSSDDEIRLA